VKHYANLIFGFFNSAKTLLKPFQANALTTYCIQILIVLSGTTFGLLFLGLEQLIVPVTLGAIATALTDFDDRLSLRLRNLALVIILFFSVSSILEFLYPHTLWFALWLSLSSALFILMGALGQRYATISFGTILLSIYTMFGLGEYATWYEQPLYFVYGALWYGFSSIVFYLIRPTLQVQENLSESLQHMAALLEQKAQLFDPDQKQHVEQLLFALSQKNTLVIQSFNRTKDSLLTRLKASRANQNSIYWLNLYFLTQDIHEQATANYLHYEHIHQHFSRTDLIFRIQKNIRFQAEACQQLAQAVLYRTRFQVSDEAQYSLQQLEASMQDWITEHPENIEVKNLQLILSNLRSVQDQLLNLQADQALYHHQTRAKEDLTLFDDDVRDHRDLWLKIKPHLGPQSALFRHAVRIAFVFMVGYGISLMPFAKNGYWILLTSLFVCQISYFATKSRLKLRTLGTLLGVLLGLPILYFVPSVEGQLLLTVIFGVGFFYLRSKKYAMATLMATLMVLLIFNLKGAGYAVIVPRIVDTLLGCFIAWFAVTCIWPDWNFRNISNNIRKSSHSSLNYFTAVLSQYEFGRNNSIQYRTARRLAHNAQIDLSSMISSLSTEPNPNPILVQHAFRYLVYSHSQLSYIAALGSHREQVNDLEILNLMQQCYRTLHSTLILEQPLNTANLEQQLLNIQSLNQQQHLSAHLQLVLKQISLLLETLPELVYLRQQLLNNEIK
jgi:uncharacterized membrane protein (TIGR01666 family)